MQWALLSKKRLVKQNVLCVRNPKICQFVQKMKKKKKKGKIITAVSFAVYISNCKSFSLYITAQSMILVVMYSRVLNR